MNTECESVMSQHIYLSYIACVALRKADAGMTSGVVISVVVFSIYDRFCPPALVLP
jgi:hypothetical protein